MTNCKMKTQKRKCLIRSNKDIKQTLYDRITQAGLTYSEVVKEARETYGRRFTVPMLSRYFNFEDVELSCQIAQEDVIWLCDRYGIRVYITVKKLTSKDFHNKQKIKRKYA